ncbi:hypothetical protein Tsubulata_017187 [Turnera subulata]|uniref:Uncharacterized protein n=1 Tax=Turnera subulata TaxID=218843 RepID=A0A9Q0GIV2_9ROSI|nr:hypothetical protein Tsubulata_017187 [Turnera subulata]
MKPHSLSTDGSLAHESKRTIGEKLKQAIDAATVNMARKGLTGKGSSSNLMFSKENGRRDWSYRAEEPIRTMMFLGSWSHT